VHHTAGPWTASRGKVLRVNKVGTGTTICGIYQLGARTKGQADPEADANATLIAAAPDLLQSCIALLSVCKDDAEVETPYYEIVQEARYAVRKATASRPA
jgi:hypothetical protein